MSYYQTNQAKNMFFQPTNQSTPSANPEPSNEYPEEGLYSYIKKGFSNATPYSNTNSFSTFAQECPPGFEDVRPGQGLRRHTSEFNSTISNSPPSSPFEVGLSKYGVRFGSQNMNSLTDAFQQKLTLEEEEEKEETKEEVKDSQKLPSASKATSSYQIRAEIHRDSSTNIRFNKKKYQSSCKMSSAQVDAKQKKNSILSEGITEMVKNKKTTQVLQNEVMNASSAEIDMVISRIQTDIQGVLFHKYGNYFLSILISVSTSAQRTALLRSIRPYFLDACFNCYAMHPIQALLSAQNTSEEESIIRASIKGKLANIAIHQQGCYIAMKVVRFIKGPSDELFLDLLPQVVDISKTEKGIIVIKKLLPELKDTSSQISIVNKFTERLYECIDDSYSNYALQLIVELWKSPVTDPIFGKLIGNVIKYSMEKISSNVVEKMVAVCTDSFRNQFINEIGHSPKLIKLVENSYGNYVLQKVLNLALPKDIRVFITEAIYKCVGDIKDSKIKEKWIGILETSKPHF